MQQDRRSIGDNNRNKKEQTIEKKVERLQGNAKRETRSDEKTAPVLFQSVLKKRRSKQQ